MTEANVELSGTNNAGNGWRVCSTGLWSQHAFVLPWMSVGKFAFRTLNLFRFCLTLQIRKTPFFFFFLHSYNMARFRRVPVPYFQVVVSLRITPSAVNFRRGFKRGTHESRDDVQECCKEGGDIWNWAAEKGGDGNRDHLKNTPKRHGSKVGKTVDSGVRTCRCPLLMTVPCAVCFVVGLLFSHRKTEKQLG